MTKRLILLVGGAVLLAIALALVLWLRPQPMKPIVGMLVSVQPPVCTQNINEPECGDGIMVIRTDRQVEREYRYDRDTRVIAAGGSESVAGLRPGGGVSFTLSRKSGKVVEIRTL